VFSQTKDEADFLENLALLSQIETANANNRLQIILNQVDQDEFTCILNGLYRDKKVSEDVYNFCKANLNDRACAELYRDFKSK
jgi:hypothetical protein